MDPIVQGLEITILGLTVTFTALGVFILVMMLLKRIFREKTEETETSTDLAVVSGNASDDITSELIAVIATAVSYVRGKNLSSLGSTLENGKGSWWVSNRSSAKQGIGFSIKRSGKA